MARSSSLHAWVMTSEYPPYIIGGLGTVAGNLARAIAAKQVKVSVFTKSFRRRAYSKSGAPGIRIHKIPAGKSFYRAASYKPVPFERYLSKKQVQKPDVIHVHSLEFAKAALYFKTKYRVPIVYTCHSLVSPRSRSNRLQSLLIREADRVVAPSRWLNEKILDRYPEIAGKTQVIYHGVAVRNIRSSSQRHKLLFVGRLIRLKGIDQLIRSMGILSKRNRNVRLAVVGTGSRAYSNRLRYVAKAAGVSSKIRWLGFKNQYVLRRLYKEHGALVMPSKEESFGLVALEAMASGIPLVATRAGGLVEFVDEHKAQIIKSVTPKGIAGAIQAMWRNSGLTQKRVRTARRASLSFNWTKAANQYIRMFEHLTD